ncbi:glycosyltransferase family 4 protein [Roseateles saccharophilus]|uniref:Glycosyltransferase involved in cell wall biosynthesis n=1 Tax=Roseateles saccharophilus TaxID=304 RepID=A0A4R3V9S7_ROSSA|nr:glycosyltransferase family 1 protein [Roseateles saccharophilus]MDG0832556.1 glycosyltransferase family 1 protein [Roseateles saccharophilus]TCV00292.1 glycosyltransferase involved in cell wall biosynthesis [Roseateles saccharophilus]
MSHPPVFAIEATNLTDETSTGIGRYTRQLIEALSALDVPPEQEFGLLQMCKRSRWKLRARLAHGPRLSSGCWFGSLWPLPRPACTLLHVPDHRQPPWRVPVVATVHDLYAALNINYTDPKKRQRTLRHYEHLRDSCARLVCVSENTRQDFLRLVGGDPARLKVVHLGVSPEFRPHEPAEVDAVRARHGLGGPYLMFVGSTPNKNLTRTVEAFAAGGFGKDYTLLVCGERARAQGETLASRLAELGITSRVRFAGYVSDADLPLLYAGAAAYLFPSLYEGYGLPILEAMACGTPVLTSNRGSCPEAAAGHAVIADPEDVDALSAGIGAALSMTGAQRAAALAYARTRTWEATARGTLAVWREVLAEQG